MEDKLAGVMLTLIFHTLELVSSASYILSVLSGSSIFLTLEKVSLEE